MPIIERANGSIVVSTRITLKPGRDDDIIQLLMSADNLAATIRESMRSGIIKFDIAEAAEEESVNLDIGIEI